ncbi:MAG: hypothetical protein ABF824_00845 [Acetobacter sp.]
MTERSRTLLSIVSSSYLGTSAWMMDATMKKRPVLAAQIARNQANLTPA